MGFDAIKRLIIDLLACTHGMVPDEAVRNEIELLVVRLLRLARRKGAESAQQVDLSVAVLKYLNPAKYELLDAAAAPRWVAGLPREVSADATAAIDLMTIHASDLSYGGTS